MLFAALFQNVIYPIFSLKLEFCSHRLKIGKELLCSTQMSEILAQHFSGRRTSAHSPSPLPFPVSHEESHGLDLFLPLPLRCISLAPSFASASPPHLASQSPRIRRSHVSRSRDSWSLLLQGQHGWRKVRDHCPPQLLLLCGQLPPRLPLEP